MRTRLVSPIAIFLLASVAASAQAVKYGSNPAAAQTFVYNGATLYFEIYGTGEPLLLIHGNGSSIADWKPQIDFFKAKYRVIAMDSRGQGNSGDGPNKLTYELMADDLAALLDHLQAPPVNVVGFSDGGIEALLLGMRHPAKVKKLVSMSANLNPGAIYPETQAMLRSLFDALPPDARQTPKGIREYKLLQLMRDEPHIDVRALEKITAPTLVLAGDHDLILDEHTLDIYHHIPNSQLGIFPNATHLVPIEQPELFNAIVDQFLRTPFVKKDRIKDFVESSEKAKSAQK